MTVSKRKDVTSWLAGHRRATAGLAGLSVLLLSSTVHGQSVWNNTGADNWTTESNWDPSGVPTASTTVTIDNGGEAQITTAGQEALSLTIGGAAGASGTLTITHGGTLTTTSPTPTIVGGSGTGVITVSRIGSSWINAGGLIVGDASGSQGGLTIDMGATVTTGTTAGTTTIFGNQAGSTGSLSVDGDGSSFTAGNTLIIGNAGAGTLRVSSGGLVVSAGAVLGASEGGTGAATVTGLGSLWQSSGELAIGRAGTGTLLIEAAGGVTTDSATLGIESTGIGAIKVSGSGSSLTVADTLTLGSAGTGELTVESGGAVTTADAIFGALSGGIGTAKITGAGSSLTTTGTFVIGSAGQGGLTVEGGASATSAVATLGGKSGGVGAAVITGSGSNWTTSGSLTIGDSGSGSLTVQAGGSAVADSAIVGSAAGGIGFLIVNGTGSSFATTTALAIGDASTGTLTIVGGGSATSGTTALGAQSTGSGTVVVSGIGSQWTTGGSLDIGALGKGVVGISLGATTSSGAATLGTDKTGEGSVLVTDNGSAWAIDGTLDVGAAGTGTLEIGSGGSVSSGATTIGTATTGTGTILVTNLGSSLAVDGALTIGEAGTGTLTVASSGTVTSGAAILGAIDGATGTASVSGSGSDWSSSGSMTVGASGAGTLQITAAGTVESGAGMLGEAATGSGSVLVDGLGSTWTVGGDMVIGNAGTGTLTLSNEGAIEVGGGSGTVTLAAASGSTGTLVIGTGAGAGTLAAAEVTGGDGTASVVLNHAESDYIFDPRLTGSLSLTQQGGGTTILTAVNDYSGATSIESGTLRAGTSGAFSAASATSVSSGGTLDLAGFDQTLPSLVNNGSVSIAGTTAGTTLTIAGNYSGTGALTLGAKLGGSNSVTDQLVIGGSASGSTRLTILNLGGNGARTTGNGIEIISVAGNSPSSAFSANRAVAGAWDYELYQGGVGSDAGNGNWYLRSDLSLAAQTYAVYPSTLLAYSVASVGTLRQRTGGWTPPPSQSGLPEGGWIRGAGIWSNVTATQGSNYEQGLQFGQAGIEAPLPVETTNGVLSGGLMATFGHSSTTVAVATHGKPGTGTIDTSTYGVGGNVTWRDRNGFYADALGQLTIYDTSFSTSDIGTLASGSGALGFAGSLEVGRSFDMSPTWAIVPQAQLVYSGIGFDTFTDRDGTTVSSPAGNGLVGRAGVRIEHDGAIAGAADAMRLNAYIVANLAYAFVGGSDVAISGTVLNQQTDALMGELGLGATLHINASTSLYGEASYATAASSSFGDDSRWAGGFGLTVQW